MLLLALRTQSSRLSHSYPVIHSHPIDRENGETEVQAPLMLLTVLSFLSSIEMVFKVRGERSS